MKHLVKYLFVLILLSGMLSVQYASMASAKLKSQTEISAVGKGGLPPLAVKREILVKIGGGKSPFLTALDNVSHSSEGIFTSNVDDTKVALISVDELKNKVSANEPVLILDVRSSESYANSRLKIKGALHFSVRKLKFRLSFPPLKDVPKDRAVVTYCACPSEEASIVAAKVLLDNGFKNVKALKGGWTEWQKANGPVEARATN
ncbi:MAG TPA: rhodanese-like domain-containing protein [Pyrinomonadaceae bacterium]